MINFILGAILGFVIATVGFGNITHSLDSQVASAQHYLKANIK